LGLRLLGDLDEAALAALPEGDRARARGEDGVVAAKARPRAGAELRPSLAHDNHPGLDLLAAEDLHAQHLRLAVAAVARRSECLLVRHYSVPSFGSALGLAALGLAAVLCFAADSVFGFAGASAFAAGFGLSAASVSAGSGFGFAAARVAPMAVISICVSLARWPACRLYPVRFLYLPMRILSPSALPTTLAVTCVPLGAKSGFPSPPT